MVLEIVLRGVIVALLLLSLAVFLVRLPVARRRGKAVGTDFGTAFSVFLAAWIGTELVAAFAPASWSGGEEILHLVVLLAFAGWMNLRWRWALRGAGLGP